MTELTKLAVVTLRGPFSICQYLLQLETSVIGKCYNSGLAPDMTYRDPACPQLLVSAGPVEPRPEKQFGGILGQRQRKK